MSNTTVSTTNASPDRVGTRNVPMMRRRSGVLAATALVVVGLIAGACGGDADEAASDAEPDSLGWVGTVEGTDAFVSVIVADSDTDADEAIVYVCDGDAELREWFQGEVDDPTSFELSNEAGASVTVEFADGTFSGEFTQTVGSVHSFDTAEATGDSGLYEVDDEEAADDGVWAAWVVDNDGKERGAFLRFGAFQPTPTLSSTSFQLSRFSITDGIIIMNGIVAPNN